MTGKSEEIQIRNIRNLDKLKQFIDDLPNRIRGKATEVAADYLVDNALRPYDPYQYFSRAEAYGMDGASGDWTYKRNGKMYTMMPVPGYFSARQFHYVMARIKSRPPGEPHRTGVLQRGWYVSKSGYNDRRGGVRIMIANDAPGAGYVMGAGMQARQPAGAGWRTDQDRIAKAAPDAVRAMADFIQSDILTREGVG